MPCSPIHTAPIGSVSRSFSLWKRLYTNRYYIILILATYTMILYVEFKRKMQTPLKLHRFAAHAGVWSVKKKKMCIPGSLSLSLSLSLERERERERESERRGGRVRVSWLAGSHPAYPIGPMCTNHPWHPTAPGPLYQPNACQPPRPTLSGERVPTTLACPIGWLHGGCPSLPYQPNT